MATFAMFSRDRRPRRAAQSGLPVCLHR